MADILRIKRRTTGVAGAPSALANAELAYNETDHVLYYGEGTGGTGGGASVMVGIAGQGLSAATPPLMNGAAAAGTATTWSRSDHVHPSDTSRAPLASPAFTGAPTAPTPATADSSTSLATTSFVKAQGYAVTGSVPQPSSTTPGMDGTAAIGVLASYARGDHVHPTDSTRAPLANPGFTGVVTIGGSITGVGMTAWAASPAPIGSATPSTGAFTSLSATSTVSGAGFTNLLAPYALLTTRLDQFAAPNVDVSWNSRKITNLATPINTGDAANKAYVDANATGLSAKGAVACATAGANITLSGLQTIDGYTTLANDRVLVKDQTTAANNGIYVAASTAWVRATDMDAWAEVPQAYVFVTNGSVNSSSSWVCNSASGGTIGTTAITWVQFSQAAQVTAGAGLTRTGNSFDVIGTTGRIAVFADNVDIDTNYAGQASINTLGTIATGTWNAATIAVARGGTGATALTGFLVGNGTSPVTALGSIPNTSISGLGTMSTQNANAVTITGGTIDNVTIDGGSF